MKLSAIFLVDVGSVNIYQESQQLEMTEGDSATVYIQLRDLAVQTAYQGYKNPGRRYVPAVGATLSIQIDTMNSANIATVTKVCAQPFVQDPSIWMFTILPTDPVAGTKRLKLTLTEGAKISAGVVNSALLVTPSSFGPAT
jgi:hypothetical protein